MTKLLIPILAVCSGVSVAQSWRELGPAPIGSSGTYTGRVSAIACSRTNPNLYYCTGADGGVWKSVNAGASWTPLTDQEATTAMGAIALDPLNEEIIYAGTGEANFANHSRYGLGLLKSTDGGATWQLLAKETFAGRCFSRILIHPTNTQVIYASITQAGGFPALAAGRGHPQAGGPYGVFRSTDGGSTWTHLTNGLPGDLSATDIAIDPVNPQTLYAAIGHHFGDARNGVYKTTDGGDSWTKLGGGFPTSNVGRITLALAPSSPQRVYASVVYSCDAFGGGASTMGVYRTDDGGQTWVYKNPGSTHATYGWYLNTMIVHPTDPNLAILGGLDLKRTRNGGDGWTTITGAVHVDFHALAYDASNRLLVGCDGGIYRGTYDGNSFQPLNSGLGIIQMYAGISIDPANPTTVFAGLQDNGTVKRTSDALNGWIQILGGDGGYTGVKPGSPNIVFAEMQGTGQLYRSTNGGTSFSFAGSGINSGDRNCFLPPYEFDPVDPNRMLYATHRLYQSTNGGTSWSVLTGDLTGGTGAIRGFQIAPSDNKTLYVGTNDGLIQVSRDGGATWNLSLTSIPGWPRVVRQFAINPSDPTDCYLAVSYFNTAQVLRTQNAGLSWQAVDATFPDLPANTVAIDPRKNPPAVYVGADGGVFRSYDGGASWSKYGTGLPNTAVIDFRLDTMNNRLIAATQGRGAWEIPIVDSPSEEDVFPTGLSVLIGTQLSGSVADLVESDDVYLKLGTTVNLAMLGRPVLSEIILSANLSDSAVTGMDVVYEGRNSVMGTRRELKMFDYAQQLWITIYGPSDSSITDEVITVSNVPDPQRFVRSQDGAVQLRCVNFSSNRFALFQAWVDQAKWHIRH